MEGLEASSQRPREGARPLAWASLQVSVVSADSVSATPRDTWSHKTLPKNCPGS